ncbi:MAG: hypothetical protein AB1757_30240 [Acidobacteriota bacterium]
MLYATKPLVMRWLQVGKKEGATYMLLVEDTLAEENVPVYVAANEQLNDKMKRFNDAHSMRIKAVFDLHADLESQLNIIYW